MGVASWPLVVWVVDGPGPVGVLALAEGWVVGRRALLCGVVGCLVLGVGDTPACFCFLLVWGVGAGGCPLVRAGVRVWGWHAVGVLG